jgi:hypothetical protein
MSVVTPVARASAPWGPPNLDPAPCGTGGRVREVAPAGFSTTFEVVATDCQGKVIPGSEQRKTGQGNVIFDVPGSINGVKVGDYRNHTISNSHVSNKGLATSAAAPDPAGAENYLNIESLYKDPLTGLWTFEGAFAQYDHRSGGQTGLRIPDLYADTNHDGAIGAGDVLYSWVDLRVYPDALPIYVMGGSFNIVNGVVAGLPGMWFSATEIYLDPLLGPQPTGGQWFNSTQTTAGALAAAASDNALALTEHELLPPVPEPASWVSFAAGLACLLGLKRRGGMA